MEWDKQSSTMIFIAKLMMYCKLFFFNRYGVSTLSELKVHKNLWRYNGI